MEGASTENTPLSLFDIKEACSSDQCDYTGQLSTNPYGWNAHANVLYLDQPRYVGFSFGYGDYVNTSPDAGVDFVTFLNSWLDYFPELKGREIIVTGESYGGHYVPAMADAMMNYNSGKPSEQQLNLAGLVIGNGCVNNTVQNGDRYNLQH
jgi:carboxypeptidase C (cathepsin A)